MPNALGQIVKGEHLSASTEFKAGCVPFMKGRHHTPETREKMRLAKLGRKLTEEHKRKIGLAGIGKKHTEESKHKLSIAHTGMKKPWSAKNLKELAKKQIGKNHPRWKGGTSRAYKDGYYSYQYKNWRRTVFIRDEFTCQRCNIKHTYLEAHHIKPFSQFPVLRFEPTNGVTLCKDCHKVVHGKGTRKLLFQKV